MDDAAIVEPVPHDAVDALVQRFVRIACDEHVTLGVFRAALFGLAASELHRLVHDPQRGEVPAEVVALEEQLSIFATTVTALVLERQQQRPS